ncbi:MAG: hypothetical protein A2017_18130 [Lentisphaerae bacterium GWF2_44_16]|nr:MAG: hypothetical protein A2017_18130 [Lentisphaerae bacterium GWF2_44_16]
MSEKKEKNRVKDVSRKEYFKSVMETTGECLRAIELSARSLGINPDTREDYNRRDYSNFKDAVLNLAAKQ